MAFSLVLQARDAASYNAAVTAVGTGSLAGVACTWAGGLTGANRPKSDAHRLLYVDVQTRTAGYQLMDAAEKAGHRCLGFSKGLSLDDCLDPTKNVHPAVAALEGWVRGKGGAR